MIIMEEDLIEDLKADIAEFQNMLDNHAKRDNVKKVLASWIEKCQGE